MAYFPNGTAGMCYEEQWCANCVHSKFDQDEGMCPVMLAHNIYNYDLCNDKEHPGKVILEWLIPTSADGIGAERCEMFHPLEASLDDGKIVDGNFAREQRQKYEQALAEMRRAS